MTDTARNIVLKAGMQIIDFILSGQPLTSSPPMAGTMTSGIRTRDPMMETKC
jgi:hypothetical protein